MQNAAILKVMKQILYLLASILAGAELCSGQTVLNGSFEEGDAPPLGGVCIPTKDSTAIRGWTVRSGSVDYIGDDTWQAAYGSRSLDLSGHDAGSIMQNVSGFTPGNEYRLYFYMAANSDGSPAEFHLRASVGSVTQTFAFDATGHKYADMGWSLKTMDFTATSATMALTFTSLNRGVAGPALDNVCIGKLPEAE